MPALDSGVDAGRITGLAGVDRQHCGYRQCCRLLFHRLRANRGGCRIYSMSSATAPCVALPPESLQSCSAFWRPLALHPRGTCFGARPERFPLNHSDGYAFAGDRPTCCLQGSRVCRCVREEIAAMPDAPKIPDPGDRCRLAGFRGGKALGEVEFADDGRTRLVLNEFRRFTSSERRAEHDYTHTWSSACRGGQSW